MTGDKEEFAAEQLLELAQSFDAFARLDPRRDARSTLENCARVARERADRLRGIDEHPS